MKIVVVSWLDAYSNTLQFTAEHAAELQSSLPTTSAGFLIHENEERVVLAQSCTEEDQYRCILVIPRAIIDSIKVVSDSDV